ncbi:hypothetical protein GLYMA_20G099750v4 [Glycine max]|nr:hypothetical protein GLYMA_20G099750v4 [Glycine max]KAH1035413.1 hypothetical protein GYH30_055404 [Glycine max]
MLNAHYLFLLASLSSLKESLLCLCSFQWGCQLE